MTEVRAQLVHSTMGQAHHGPAFLLSHDLRNMAAPSTLALSAAHMGMTPALAYMQPYGVPEGLFCVGVSVKRGQCHPQDVAQPGQRTVVGGGVGQEAQAALHTHTGGVGRTR